MKTATDLLNIMHRVGNEENPTGAMLATMTSATSCRAKDYNADFTKSDLIFLERQQKNMAVKVDGNILNSSHPHDFKDKTTYNAPLKKGDLVALIPIGNKFLVLGRVVM